VTFLGAPGTGPKPGVQGTTNASFTTKRRRRICSNSPARASQWAIDRGFGYIAVVWAAKYVNAILVIIDAQLNT